MRGRLVSSVVSPSGDALASFTRSQEVIVGEGRYHIGNRRVQAPDGELRELDWWAGPLHDAAGEISGYLGVARDVTVENRSRRAHALSEERFGKLLQNLPDVPWLYSLDDERFLYVGPGFEELWGRLPPSGFGGADRLVEWVHPQDRAAVDALVQAVRRGEAWVGDVEARVVRPDGSIRWAVSRIVPILDDEGRVVEAAGYTADITARRETERALRESEERLRLIAETTRDVFFLVSADRSKVYYVNPAFERVWGLPCEALYADPRLFLKRMHPDDCASVASAIARQSPPVRCPPRCSSSTGSCGPTAPSGGSRHARIRQPTRTGAPPWSSASPPTSRTARRPSRRCASAPSSSSGRCARRTCCSRSSTTGSRTTSSRSAG